MDWKLSDYFGAPVVDKSQTIAFQPHSSVTIVEPFVAATEARAYQLDLKTRPAEDFKPPIPRPLDMIELNDWSKLELLPDLAGPAEIRLHIRKDLTSLTTGDRRAFSLEGNGWERGLTAQRRFTDKPPADIKWGGAGVPCSDWYPPKGYFGFWYRKKFQVPTWLRGQTLQLEIGKAFRQGVAFINGQRVPGVCYGAIPLRADVTGLLKLDGENELTVMTLGEICLSREDYVDRYNPDAWIENDGHRDYPPTDDNIGAGLAGVWLGALPEVRVRQTLVIPDVDKGQVIVFNRVENRSKDPCTVELRYAMSQQGKEVPQATVPSQSVTLKPGEIVEVKSVGNGQGLRPYTPASPVLTKLATTVTEKGLFSKKVLDVEEMRFGYRTVKVKGAGLTLNAQPVALLGTGPMGSGHEIFDRENGTTVSRCLPYSLDAMDEVGRLYYPYITSSWPAAEWELLNNDRYWQRDCDLGVERIWEMGSRPCCVGWDVSNECYNYACYQVGGEGQSKLGQRFLQVVQDVRKRTWPDFWFLADGNESIGGRIPYTSWHYLNHQWANVYWNGCGLNHEAYKGVSDISSYPPDCFFLDGAASEPKPTSVVHGTNAADDWRLGMPCASTEEFWFTDANNGPAVCKFVGEKGALSPGYQFGSGGACGGEGSPSTAIATWAPACWASTRTTSSARRCRR